METAAPMQIQGKYGEALIYAPYVEQEAMSILFQYFNHPASKGQKIRIMPDVHAGKGVVVGFTATLNEDFVIPNIIGVDIGCGVYSVNIGKEIPPFEEIDQFIRENIPAGMNVHENTKHLKDVVDKGFIEEIKEVAQRTNQDIDYVFCSIGTLGGGNHFIEIGQSQQTGDYYLTIHSGSRNFGLKVAVFHQKTAENTCRKEFFTQEVENLKKQYTGKELGRKIEKICATKP